MCYEQFHRELKQFTGVKQYQCRKQRIQRNYIAYAILVWGKIKQIAYETSATWHELKHGLRYKYLAEELDLQGLT